MAGSLLLCKDYCCVIFAHSINQLLLQLQLVIIVMSNSPWARDVLTSLLLNTSCLVNAAALVSPDLWPLPRWGQRSCTCPSWCSHISLVQCSFDCDEEYYYTINNEYLYNTDSIHAWETLPVNNTSKNDVHGIAVLAYNYIVYTQIS